MEERQLVRWESTAGAEDWERRQTALRTLPARKYLSEIEKLDEAETWETDLAEVWHFKQGEEKRSMQFRLEEMLKVNPLDYELKPFSDRTVPSVADGKTTDGTPMNIMWVAGPDPEVEKQKQNSDHIMSFLKFWDLDLPNIVLITRGGHDHPYKLIKNKILSDQRADFLKSRPRFNESYFDGQRDPAAGWMAAGAAWRYPAFYVSNKHDDIEFTFLPSHTLFIDASMQVAEDGEAELIEVGDRTNNDWILDTVTHQPLGRQAAIKGMGSVFYWDLNLPTLKVGSAAHVEPNLRKGYEEWIRGQAAAAEMAIDDWLNARPADGVKPYKFLLGITKRKNIDQWEKFVVKILLKEKDIQKTVADSKLSDGEVRVELTQLKFNKTGLAKIDAIARALAADEAEQQEANSLFPDGFGAVGGLLKGGVGAVTGGMGALTGGLTSGLGEMLGDSENALVLVKLQIPGDDEIVSQPIRVSKGPVPKIARFEVSKRSYHDARDGRAQSMQARIASKNSAESLLRISVVLAAPDGSEMQGVPEIAEFRYSLKEMIQDVPVVNGAHEFDGGGVDVSGNPPPKLVGAGKGGSAQAPEKKKKKKSKKKSAVAPAPGALDRQSSLGSSRSLRRQCTGSLSVTSEASFVRPSFGGLAVQAPPDTPHSPSDRYSDDEPIEKIGKNMSALTESFLSQRPTALGRIVGRIAFRPPSSDDLASDHLSAVTSTELERKKAAAATDPATPAVVGGTVDAQEALLKGFSTVLGKEKGDQLAAVASEARLAAKIGHAATSFKPRASGGDGGDGRRNSGDGTERGALYEAALAEVATVKRLAAEQEADIGAGALPPPSRASQGSQHGSRSVSPERKRSPSPDGTVRDSMVATLRPELFMKKGGGSEAGSFRAGDAGEGYASRGDEMDIEGQHENQGGGNVNEDNFDEDGVPKGRSFQLLSAAMVEGIPEKTSLLYTVAHWILWRTVESIGDQYCLFGDPRNMPLLVRDNKLGSLVDNQFCSTEYDPRWAGDNWQLVVVCNDGAYSKFYVGYSSVDESGVPEPCRSLEPMPGRAVTDVKTEMSIEAQLRKLNTAGRGAGWIAQSWIWPRDLQGEEVKELWMATKDRYPRAQRGLPTEGLGHIVYRPPPNPFATHIPMNNNAIFPRTKAQSMSPRGSPGFDSIPNPSGGASGEMSRQRTPGAKPPRKLVPMSSGGGGGGPGGFPGAPVRAYKPPPPTASIIEKDMRAFEDVPLVNRLAFQRLLNVFTVLVDFAVYSKSYIVIDRLQNMSCTAELMLECALRKSPTTAPTVMVLDCRARLEKANHKLKELKRAGFLQTGVEQRLQSTDFLNANLRSIVTPQGMTWLKADTHELEAVKRELGSREDESRRLDAQHIKDLYELYGDEADLQRDGRPKQEVVWKNFYAATLFASGTHYIIFDVIDPKARSLLATLGTVGTLFMAGGTAEHAKIVDTIQSGAPLLLLESTGGVTQAFAHAMKAVRLFRPKWQVDYVLRLITDYKARASAKNGEDQKSDPRGREPPAKPEKIFALENIHLLDRELARIDLLLSDEVKEAWMANFGLPEMLMLFERWQRAQDYVMRQVQTADVMKKNAEDLLDLFTGCFSSSAGGVPELGLGKAETKVVATAWNRHLLLYHNGMKYCNRSWIMQGILYWVAFCSSSLSIFITSFPILAEVAPWLDPVMLVLPIIAALLGTIGTRLRQRQKYAVAKMASFEIVSEIYKFRVRAIEYDQLALAAQLAAKQSGGDKNDDEDTIPKPISGKERDKVARNLFVERVSQIYEACLMKELSSGTAISHTANFGLDPQRLLRESDEDSERETRKLLQLHVAENLYFLKNEEWEKGAEGFKEKNDRAVRLRQQRRLAMLKALNNAVYLGIGGGLVNLASQVEDWLLEQKAKRKHKAAVRRGEAHGPYVSKKDRKYKASEQVDTESGAAATSMGFDKAPPTKLQRLKQFFQELTDKNKRAAEIADEEKIERLDESYMVREDMDEEGATGGSDGGASVGDNLLGPLTIDDYYLFRARPLVTYLERAAPWRAFEMQFLEILIFIFNSLGAVLVGMSLVAYVPLTVAISAIIASFLDFTNLGKQVEAYNNALQEVHNVMNEWNGKTRTERRTRQTVTQVVGTVELGITNVAIALTNGMPTGASADDEGEGEEGEDK